MKVRISSLLILYAVVAPWSALATPISATEVVDDWIRVSNPLTADALDFWRVSTLEPDTVEYPLTRGSGIVSDYLVSGDFSFTARLYTPFTSSQRFGVFFGYQDNEHHYRVSFAGPGAGVAPRKELNGDDGLVLMRRNGFNPVLGNVSLFNDSSLYFAQDTEYDVNVFRSGDEVGFSLLRVSDGTLLAESTVTDTTFITGRIGLWTAHVNSSYRNLDLTLGSNGGDAPEPASLMLVLAGLAGAGFRCRRHAPSR